ncbi:MAG: DUF1801 domain-containing protein [Proteobacteria bacterium]|uniref:DUF1801 domain-containing protein n=1 Tax=Rudaea sp. TaxID=2136325 RepID=UPI003220857E|nr:DUF1801 domain-containing protein [Pseudomonadota bacterium]
MPRSTALSIEDYLVALPPVRREVIATVRKLILENLPQGYEETLAWGMLGYGIPLARYPHTYNGQPLGYVALAAQKGGYSLYLMGAYMDPARDRALREAFAAQGLKLDMGKSCLRFKSLADLHLPAIARSIAGMSVAQYIELYERVRAPTAAIRETVAKKVAPKQAAAKKTARKSSVANKPAAAKPAVAKSTRKK